MANELKSLKRINPLGDSELIIAGRNGEVARLRSILNELIGECGFSKKDAVEIISHHSSRLGKTVLHEAAQASRVECVRYLVGKEEDGLSMDPDCLKQGDWTPLMLACTKNSLDVIRILVDAGASLNLRNKDGWTPFHIACREGHEDIISYFVNLESLELWRTKSKNGRTPLHTAALYGRDNVVRILLRAARSEIDDVDSCGSTPLMDALRGGHIEIARILIDAGADPYKCDAVGRQPIHLVAQAGQEESMAFLLQLCSQQQPPSASGKHPEISAYDLVNAETQDAFHSTPAHFAAKEGHVTILKILKENGAILDAVDSKGRSPLHMSASAQRTECVECLLSQGVPDSCDSQGTRPSHLAVKSTVKRLFC